MEICKAPTPPLKVLNKHNTHNVHRDGKCYLQFNKSLKHNIHSNGSSITVASLMVADIIIPTLSCTNSPASQHSNDYPFKPFNNHTVLLNTRKTHSIHTHDLIKAYTRRTLNQIIRNTS